MRGPQFPLHFQGKWTHRCRFSCMAEGRVSSRPQAQGTFGFSPDRATRRGPAALAQTTNTEPGQRQAQHQEHRLRARQNRLRGLRQNRLRGLRHPGRTPGGRAPLGLQGLLRGLTAGGTRAFVMGGPPPPPWVQVLAQEPDDPRSASEFTRGGGTACPCHLQAPVIGRGPRSRVCCRSPVTSWGRGGTRIWGTDSACSSAGPRKPAPEHF